MTDSPVALTDSCDPHDPRDPRDYEAELKALRVKLKHLRTKNLTLNDRIGRLLEENCQMGKLIQEMRNAESNREPRASRYGKPRHPDCFMNLNFRVGREYRAHSAHSAMHSRSGD
jgi:hypothetical protein